MTFAPLSWARAFFRGMPVAAMCCDGGLLVEWDGRRAEFMAFTSSLAISLSCLLVVSLALQILIHFSRVSLLSANNFFLMLFSRIPRTKCSLRTLVLQCSEIACLDQGTQSS